MSIKKQVQVRSFLRVRDGIPMYVKAFTRKAPKKKAIVIKNPNKKENK